MKNLYLLGILYWVLSLLVKSIILMQAWNLLIVNIFTVNNITYLMSLGLVLILGLFTKRRHFHRKGCTTF